MGRWKLGAGGAYYDSQDSGPDQVAPPPAAPQTQAPQVGEATTEPPQAAMSMQPAATQQWQGPLSIDFGQDGGYQWGSPGDQQRRVGGASQLLDWLRSMGIGKNIGGDMGANQLAAKTDAAPVGAQAPEQRSIGNGLPSAAGGGMVRGGMTALGKGASGLGMLGRGLFGR